jgi:alkaline phosphatase
MDVVLGGGYKFLTPQGRTDKEDMISVIRERGYDLVTTPEAMSKSTSGKLWGMFSDTAMAYEMDRDAAKEPSLADMTSKAIQVLSKNNKGFFLMVEGSKVDWAAHANDPIGIISDVLAFDAAVKVALDYAKASGNTAVIAVTDHGNGGISIGSQETTKSYDKEPLSTFIDPLLKAKLTGEGLEKKFNADMSNVKEVMAEYFGITDLTADEIKSIQSAKKGSMNYAVGPMISKRARIGWTTGGHTGEDVVLYTYAPNGDRLFGVVDNTDIAKYIARVLGLDLAALNKQLFVPARSALEAKGATVEFDNVTDPLNPVLVVTKGSDTYKLPVYRSVAFVNGKAVQLSGVVVFNGVNCFVPQDAVDLVK